MVIKVVLFFIKYREEVRMDLLMRGSYRFLFLNVWKVFFIVFWFFCIKNISLFFGLKYCYYMDVLNIFVLFLKYIFEKLRRLEV